MVLPTVLLPVQQMCFCVQGENVIFHACMHVWVCVWEWMVISCYIEFIHHARHLQERQKARGCNLGALLVSSLLSFLLYIAYWNGDLDKGCKRQKKKKAKKRKGGITNSWRPEIIFFLLYFFFHEWHVKVAFECQTCVKHVQCDASSWDALFRYFLLVHISFILFFFFTLVQML